MDAKIYTTTRTSKNTSRKFTCGSGEVECLEKVASRDIAVCGLFFCCLLCFVFVCVWLFVLVLLVIVVGLLVFVAKSA